MLSEPATQIERRILAMRTTTRRFMRLTVYGGTTVAAAALFLACSLKSDGPTGPSPSSAARPTAVNAAQTFFEFQVEKQVTPAPGNHAPQYPTLLRESNIDGAVLAQFVVDTLGRADMGTFKVLKSDHDLFTASVRGNLPDMKFNPAEVGGRKVKQLVQMPFQFSLSKDDGPAVVATERKPVPRKLGPNEVWKLPAVVTAAGSADAAAPKRVSDSTTFKEFQIEKQATELAGNPGPRYPEVLRSANAEGEVTAQFVVDTDGRPIPSTLKIVASSHDLFTTAVRNALPNIKYSPATVGGKAVKQLVKKTFTFSLQK
jgi:TonB family protein